MRFSIHTAAIVAAGLVVSVMGQQDPQQPTQSAAAGLSLNAFTALGCYNYSTNMWDMGPYTFQSTGWCQPLCVRQGALYFGLVNGTNCFCGNSAPDSSKKASPDDCNAPCSGIDTQYCGGTNKWAIYQDGLRGGDPTGSIHITTPTQTWFGHQATSSTLSTSVTNEQSTIVITAAGAASTQTDDSDTNSSAPNKVAIAVGVVVGVLGLVAIVGATVFYLRQRKKRELEEERRRHEAVMNIVNRGEKAPSSFGSDSRLEPSVMFQRRQSDGSIMDNEDYSRRILKVANPDDR